jgi:hypothetical protein
MAERIRIEADPDVDSKRAPAERHSVERVADEAFGRWHVAIGLDWPGSDNLPSALVNVLTVCGRSVLTCNSNGGMSQLFLNLCRGRRGGVGKSPRCAKLRELFQADLARGMPRPLRHELDEPAQLTHVLLQHGSLETLRSLVAQEEFDRPFYGWSRLRFSLTASTGFAGSLSANQASISLRFSSAIDHARVLADWRYCFPSLDQRRCLEHLQFLKNSSRQRGHSAVPNKDCDGRDGNGLHVRTLMTKRLVQI